MVDEMERSVHDALCAVKRVLESNYVCPGGGAVEAALSIYLGKLIFYHRKTVISSFVISCKSICRLHTSIGISIKEIYYIY